MKEMYEVQNTDRKRRMKYSRIIHEKPQEGESYPPAVL